MLKKTIAMLAAFLLVAALFAGCAKTKDDAEAIAAQAAAVSDAAAKVEESAAEDAAAAVTAANADTASAFYSAYMEGKSAVLSKIMDGLSSNPDTMMSAISFLGASMSDIYMLPAMYFGLGEGNVAAALTAMGAKDVVYRETGNSYSVTYQNSEGRETVLNGTYDAGKSLVCTGSTDGVENIFSETYMTSFGYVGQFYSIADDGTATLYQFSVSGENGAIGMTTGKDRPAALTGDEAADFPKSATEWYAIDGTVITGVNSEGSTVEFTYTPSESND
jgi:predicted small secreted protein